MHGPYELTLSGYAMGLNRLFPRNLFVLKITVNIEMARDTDARFLRIWFRRFIYLATRFFRISKIKIGPIAAHTPFPP